MSDSNSTSVTTQSVALSSAGGQPANPPARAPISPVADDTNSDLLEQPEDGGEVESADSLSTYNPQRDREGAAKQLAIIFACILAGGLALHYTALISLTVFGFSDSLKELNNVFNIWLPVVSSLVSAIATYYFTRTKN
jgi:hypothetical protein